MKVKIEDISCLIEAAKVLDTLRDPTMDGEKFVNSLHSLTFYQKGKFAEAINNVVMNCRLLADSYVEIPNTN